MTSWTGKLDPFWAANDERYDTILAPLTRHLLAAASIGPAERVLDVGCGCGATTRLAGQAAPDGHALGVDVSEPMLAVARRRAAEAGLTNVDHQRADAQTHPVEPADVVISRLGVMFFDDPVAAFTNLRRTGGRLAFVCWQPFELNENRVLRRAVLSAHIEVPPVDQGTGGLSLAEPDTIRAVLSAAGYRDIALTDLREPLPFGRTAAEATEFGLAEPTVAEWLAAADPAAAGRAADALHAAYAERETSDGVLLESAAWLVTAR